jgi:hypothetical protein
MRQASRQDNAVGDWETKMRERTTTPALDPSTSPKPSDYKYVQPHSLNPVIPSHPFVLCGGISEGGAPWESHEGAARN